MSSRVTITGATGLIGRSLVDALQTQGAEVTVLSRDPSRARERFAADEASPVQAFAWDLMREPAPAEALSGRDAIVHLAGENIAQRWSAKVRQAIRQSRLESTSNLVRGIAACPPAQRPGVLVSASAVGYYGAHGEEPIDEGAPPGEDFLAQVCVAWEAAAQAASELGVRVVRLRTGVVLDRSGGALAKMLPAFALGFGGPIAGGHQYVSWIHREDVVGIVLAALRDERFTGPVNATAPEPLTNREFSKALGRALHRPALMPLPGAALRVRYGQMAQILTSGARVLPAEALVLGYEFRYPRLEQALDELLQ